MIEPTVRPEDAPLRYRPSSPIDLFRDAVARRGIPWWAVFAVTWLLFALGLNAIRWVEGTPFPQIDLLTRDGFYPAAALAAYGLLTGAADRALDRFAPALAASADEIARSRRRLTRMPLWQSLLSFLVGAAAGVSTLTEPAYWAALTTSVPMFLLTGIVGFAIGYGSMIMVTWQVIRIVVEVGSLHRRAVDVALDRPGPTHAFAPVTAGGGAFVVAIVAYSVLTDPATLTNAAMIAISSTVSVVAILVFVLPLLGMRRRLVDEKRTTLDALGVRMRDVVQELEAAVDARRYDDVERIRAAVGALGERIDRVRRASTWPWDATVASGFVTTLVVPLAIWLVTTYAGRLLGF